MIPASLIPMAEPIPVPWAWFDVLLILTFTAHILFMNALLGSAAIGLVRAVRGNNGLMHDVGQKLPPLLALTINMGVAPLLFLQVNYGHFDYVSSVLMGGWWLGVIAALLFSYYGFYAYKFKYDAMSPGKRNTLFVLSLAGLLYVGFMLTNNTTLMLLPEAWTQYFDDHGAAFLNWSDPTIFPRFLHFMLGALAIGGLFVALLGQWRNVDEYVNSGMAWLTRATLVNLAVGMWFLIALPRDIMLGFMGGNLPATMTLVTSLLASAMLLAAVSEATEARRNMGCAHGILHELHPALGTHLFPRSVVPHRRHSGHTPVFVPVPVPRLSRSRTRTDRLHAQTLLQVPSGEGLAHGIPHLATHDPRRRFLDRTDRNSSCLRGPFRGRRRPFPRADRAGGVSHQQHPPA